MIKFRYLLVFLFVFVFSNAFGKVFDLEEFYLDNGLRVIVNENHKAPIIKTMLWYKVGAMDEPQKKGGLAHLLEHLMFRGTYNVSASSFRELMLKNGVDFNAFTTKDWTVYHALSDISRLELVLALEADRMTNLKVDEEAFFGERKIVYEERQQRVENNPKSQFSEEVTRILWKNTPYEHPVSGDLEEIKNLTKEDALAFYKRFYSPQNAILLLSGDIKPQEAKLLAEKYFGKIKSLDVPNRSENSFSNQEKGKYFIQKQMDDIQTTRISISYVIPSVLKDVKSAYALFVFSHYFGEGEHTYLVKKLIKTQKALSASSDTNVFVRGDAEFTVSLIPLPQTDNSQNIKIIEDSLKEALSALTPEILEVEKKKMLSWFVYVEDNPSDTAHLIGSLVSLGLSAEQAESYITNIENVTLADVQHAVQTMLKTSRKVTAVLMPKDEVINE